MTIDVRCPVPECRSRDIAVSGELGVFHCQCNDCGFYWTEETDDTDAD